MGATEGRVAEVFISYKRERRPAAHHLQKVLQANGFAAWYDYGLVPGEDFEARLMGELSAAKVVLVLWCGLSVQSPWVRKEADAALGRGTLAPVWIEKVAPPGDFGKRDTIDITGWDGDPSSGALFRLLSAIGDKVGRDPAPDFRRLRELHEDWVAYGRPSLPRFRTEPPPKFDPAVNPLAPVIDGASKMVRDWMQGAGPASAEPPPSPPLQGGEQVSAEGAPPPERGRLGGGQAVDPARRAAEAARAGRPIAERSFPIELPGVANWPTPQMIAVPPGKFLMGAPTSEDGSSDKERPQHEVRIDYAFALGRHVVTFAEWDAAIAAGAELVTPDDEGWGRGSRPVINVNWEDAQAYLKWLNDRIGSSVALGRYRLPSEAEWEYACRAGTTTPFDVGATIFTAQANFDGSYTYGKGVKGEYRQKTVPVGSFAANAFGFHDMHGNVWEWCHDHWNASYIDARNDGAPWMASDGLQRILRGGSWDDEPKWLRSAARLRNDYTLRDKSGGFRLARSILTLSPHP